MTDTLIPRSTAIDRMRDGLPCEVRARSKNKMEHKWHPALWGHLDFEENEFRIPPEPRREAREWWLCDDGYAISHRPHYGQGKIHVREVLPDEVVVRRMTETEVESLCQAKRISIPGYPNARVCVYFARALGLLKEEKS